MPKVSPPISTDAASRIAFIRANTQLAPVPFVREVSLHLAHEAVPLWQKTEEELGALGLPPPFWAFAWAGGQALARYLLDHADVIDGRRTLDLASGSGLVGIAAAKAGAVPVVAADIDGFATCAMALNAAANAVYLDITGEDLLAQPAARQQRFDVVLIGDLFYERDTAARVLAFAQAHAATGATILIGDPGRSYLPRDKLRQLAEYQIPVTRELEDQDIKRTAVWTLA